MARLTTEELTSLEDSLQRLLRDQSPLSAVRSTMETESGYAADLWRQLADMGITGLLIDEEFGGSGAGPVAMERIMEHVGASLMCGPLLASAVLATGLIAGSGDQDAQARLLPGIASGETIATALLTGPTGTWTEGGVALTANLQDGRWTLSGEAHYVLHGGTANCWLAVARTDQGLSLFDVDRSSSGVRCTRQRSFDRTLRIDRITLDAAPARLIGAPGRGWHAVEHGLNQALVALAGEQAGGARRMLDITVDYAKLRHQFGRPIGSYQAIKHMAADLVVESESAISAARKAAAELDAGSRDHQSWIRLAAFACADAFNRVAADGIQMHGGIAFTWDHPAHLYLRRARAGVQLFGNSAYHRDRYVGELGG
jgi:alkylation response protein AidB-like acyl-CoA dehydrogenase